MTRRRRETENKNKKATEDYLTWRNGEDIAMRLEDEVRAESIRIVVVVVTIVVVASSAASWLAAAAATCVRRGIVCTETEQDRTAGGRRDTQFTCSYRPWHESSDIPFERQ